VYDVTLLSILGNCSNTTPQTLSVTVNPLPVADSSSIVIAAASCGSSTGSISGLTVISGQSPFTYLWQNASGDTVGTNLNLTNVGPGNYILTITDANTCTSPFGAGSGLNISSTSGVVAAFTASPTTGETPLIVNFTNSSTGATSYLWQFGTGAEDVSTNPTYIYTSFGSFTACLIASNIGGCSDTACSVIDVYINSVFVIPNVFTPNDDGVNDVFGVIGKGLKTLDAEIYNRWGEKLFEWHTPNGGWDGRTASGELSPVGTYYFIVNATGDDGKHYSEKGAFTLIR
jgi:gliding motility-associated-like protein